jgi:hypothetical protein
MLYISLFDCNICYKQRASMLCFKCIVSLVCFHIVLAIFSFHFPLYQCPQFPCSSRHTNCCYFCRNMRQTDRQRYETGGTTDRQLFICCVFKCQTFCTHQEGEIRTLRCLELLHCAAWNCYIVLLELLQCATTH